MHTPLHLGSPTSTPASSQALAYLNDNLSLIYKYFTCTIATHLSTWKVHVKKRETM